MDKRSCRWPLQNSPAKTARLPVSASSLSRFVGPPFQRRSLGISVRTWPSSLSRSDFVFPIHQSLDFSISSVHRRHPALDHCAFPKTNSQATPTRRYVKSARLAANPRHAFHVSAAPSVQRTAASRCRAVPERSIRYRLLGRRIHRPGPWSKTEPGTGSQSPGPIGSKVPACLMPAGIHAHRQRNDACEKFIRRPRPWQPKLSRMRIASPRLVASRPAGPIPLRASNIR